MNVEEAIAQRHSVRSYENKQVSRSKIEELLNSARMAPSARNKQDWRFVVIDDKGQKEQISKIANQQGFVKQASAVIVGMTADPEYRMPCGVPAGFVDVAIAMDHLSLRATEEGLGTCWIGAYDPEETKELLGIPEEYRVVCMMTLGYPKDPSRQISKNRKSVNEIISYNHFGN